jgi:hypothetical protein
MSVLVATLCLKTEVHGATITVNPGSARFRRWRLVASICTSISRAANAMGDWAPHRKQAHNRVFEAVGNLNKPPLSCSRREPSGSKASRPELFARED